MSMSNPRHENQQLGRMLKHKKSGFNPDHAFIKDAIDRFLKEGHTIKELDPAPNAHPNKNKLSLGLGTKLKDQLRSCYPAFTYKTRYIDKVERREL